MSGELGCAVILQPNSSDRVNRQTQHTRVHCYWPNSLLDVGEYLFRDVNSLFQQHFQLINKRMNVQYKSHHHCCSKVGRTLQGA